MKSTVLLIVLAMTLVVFTCPALYASDLKPKPPLQGMTKRECARNTIDWSLNVAGYLTHQSKKNPKRAKIWRHWITRKRNKKLLIMVIFASGWLSSKKSGHRLAAKFGLYYKARQYCGLSPLPKPGEKPLYSK